MLCFMVHGASSISDVNGDGVPEIIVTGNVYDCDVGHPPGLYNGVYIFNADRSRFNQGGYDWSDPPVDTGAPLTEDYNVIDNCQPNPVVADLEGDGEKEILFSSYDGRVHAFWLDKTEHDSWPYSVYNSSEGFFRFASEPVVADLDGDGPAEVIFTSWVEKTDSAPVRLGKLHILNHQGDPIHEIDLPNPKSTGRYFNGALPAPTIANIDSDADLELVVNTIYAGLIAYDLPGTENATVLWATGRAGQTYLPAKGPGDVDGNGAVNLADAVFALKICAGMNTSRPSAESDVDADTRIGMEEAVFILQIVSGVR